MARKPLFARKPLRKVTGSCAKCSVMGITQRRTAPRASWYVILLPMYAQKLTVELVIGNERKPCPLEWLDSFCMRNFTNSADFDDTLPTGEGRLEASFRVKPDQLATALAAWLNQRGKGNGQPISVEIKSESAPSANVA
jgi:hypothetical protein